MPEVAVVETSVASETTRASSVGSRTGVSSQRARGASATNAAHAVIGWRGYFCGNAVHRKKVDRAATTVRHATQR
jgi:hypothetical protein